MTRDGELPASGLDERLARAQGPERIELLIERAWELSTADPGRARELALEALAAREPAGTPSRASAQIALAFAEVRLGRWDDALTTGRAGLVAALAAGDRLSEGRAHCVLGAVAYCRGDLKAAHAAYDQALSIFRSAGIEEPDDLARTHNDIGRLHFERSDYVAAHGSFRAALEASRPGGDSRQAAYAHMNLGNVLSELGDYARGLDAYRASLGVLRRLADRGAQAFLYHNLAVLHRKLGEEIDAAVAYCREAEAAARSSSLGELIGQRSAVLLAELLAARGEHDAALATLEPALASLHALGNRVGEALALRARGEVLTAIGQDEQALAAYAVAEQDLMACGETRDALVCQLNAARLLLKRGEPQAARAKLEPQLDKAIAIGRDGLSAGFHEVLGQAAEALGEAGEAARLYRALFEAERATLQATSRERLEALRVINEVEEASLREAALRAANEALEQRVAERTAELSAANEGLRRAGAERERLQQALSQRQKMEALGRLAGGITHDFNNLLTVIGVSAEKLLSALPEPHALHEPAEAIALACDRAGELTAQILAFSRREPGRLSAFEPNKRLTSLDKMLRRIIGEDIELRVVINPSAGWIRADPAQLDQALLNLAVNARDAMPSGGTLTLSTGSKAVAGHEVLADGDHVSICVSDTGSGIAPEARSLVFEPFFTTKPAGQGTGLGLAMVYSFARQCHGAIGFESEVGAGTTFELLLPRVAPESTPPGRPEPAPPDPRRRSATVLLVEDDPGVRRLAVRALEDAGHTVIEASDGAQALRLAAACALGFDVVVSDMVLPGLSGSALARSLRRQRPGLPVLFVTGYPEESATAREPATLLLRKPFGASALCDKVTELLEGPMASAEPPTP